MIGRLAYAILAGVIAFIAALVIGQLPHLEPVATYAWIIGILVAVVAYFGNWTGSRPVA